MSSKHLSGGVVYRLWGGIRSHSAEKGLSWVFVHKRIIYAASRGFSFAVLVYVPKFTDPSTLNCERINFVRIDFVQKFLVRPVREVMFYCLKGKILENREWNLINKMGK